MLSRSGSLYPDVELYEGGGQHFLLSPRELPLLWSAGGVNGQWPLPEHLQDLEEPARFTYRAENSVQGKKCVVLSVQEQNGPETRELWVGTAKPYPIYFCIIRGRTIVYRQIEADYKQQEGRLLPARWKSTTFGGSGTLRGSLTFRIDKVQVNEPLPGGFFEKDLESGQVVFDVARNRTFEVNPTRGRAFWLVGSIVLFLGVCVFLRYLKRKNKAD